MHCDELSVCRFWHSKLSNTGNLYRKELACHVEEWRPVTENDTWAGHCHEYWTSFYGSLSISMVWHSFVATFVLSPSSVLLNHRAVAQCRWNEAIAKKDFRMKQNPFQWRQLDYNNNVYRGSVDWTYYLSLRERYRAYTSYSCLREKEGEVYNNLSTCTHFVISQGGTVEFNLICLEHALKSPWNWWAKLRSLRRSGRMFGMCPVLSEIWRCQYFCLRHFVTVLIVMIWHWNLVMVDWHVFVMRQCILGSLKLR